MKRKTIAELIVILAIIAVAMFAGCVEEEAPTPTSTKVGTYKIFSEEDVSFGNTIRVVERVLVPRTITEEGVKAIAKDIVQKGIASRDVNAIGIFFYYKPEASPEYCIGSVDWAPYGVWSKAMEVPTGDYSKHEYYYDFFTKLPLPPSTSMPAPTPTPTPEPVSGIGWTQDDTDRFVSDTNRIVELLKTPILEGDIEVLEARLPKAKSDYNDTTDWLYDTDWQMNSVPQWVWELDSANDWLNLRVEMALDCSDKWLQKNELTNARCYELNAIRVFLEDMPTTEKEVETAYLKIQRLNDACRG